MKNPLWNKENGRRLLAFLLAVCVGTIPAFVYAAPSAKAEDLSADAAPAVSPSPSAGMDAPADSAPSVPPAPAIAPSCDEAFYATMDYYGQLTESSVVKSYVVNGNTKITDYGSYDSVENLTDDRQPDLSDGSVTFDLSQDTPQHFYFEGKTQKPFQALPWSVSLSYTLNGVATPADQLAGKTGVVEIHLDVVPNQDASEYSKNNLVLTATTAFNADDILSLEAPGAQVQLIGNLRSVLYMILPGEEQHFVLSVGADDFSFSGMIFLAVPATLRQLDQVADLREAKDKTQDSYDAINASLDVILNTLDGMSGSLNTTANGLDQLNSARGTFSAGKNGLYDSADLALEDLSTMADALAPAAAHLETASQTLTEVNDSLTALTQTAVGLKPELETTRSILKSLKSDTANLKKLLESVESYTKNGGNIASDLESDLEDMGENFNELESSLSGLKSALKKIHTGSLSNVENLTYLGMSADQITDYLQVASKHYPDAYKAGAIDPSSSDAMIKSFAGYLVAYKITTDPEIAGKQAAVFFARQADPDSFDKQISELKTASDMIDGVNGNISTVNHMINALSTPTAEVVDDLGSLCYTLSDSGISGDLESLSKLVSELLKDVDEHKGETGEFLDHMDEMNALAARLSQSADTALDQLQTLDDTVNAYIPEAKQSLSDAQVLADSAASALRNSQNFLGSLESLTKQSDGNLDNGTRQSLAGLSEALRRSSAGLDETDTIRTAKASVTTLIDDEWASHTGGDNNLLFMDAQASPVSLTSEKNGTPTSIQYLLRTQEIKVESSGGDTVAAPQQEDNGTFWSRVGDMFQDFWSALSKPFRKD